MAESSVQSLKRAFALLELLSTKKEGARLSEIARDACLHKSTAHRLLASLIDLGYVQKTDERECFYQLTWKLYEIAGRMLGNADIIAIARPILDGLRDACRETVHLVTRDGADIVYLYKAESESNAYYMASRIGMRRPLHCTAAGKAILAMLEADDVARIWDMSDKQALTEHTITSLDALSRELAVTRQRGYAIDDEENEAGLRCIAAAIRERTGRCRFAFSVSAPSTRMSDHRMAELAPLVREASQTIARQSSWF